MHGFYRYEELSELCGSTVAEIRLHQNSISFIVNKINYIQVYNIETFIKNNISLLDIISGKPKIMTLVGAEIVRISSDNVRWLEIAFASDDRIMLEDDWSEFEVAEFVIDGGMIPI